MSFRFPAHPRCRPLRSGFNTVLLRGLPFRTRGSSSPSSPPARLSTKPLSSSSPITGRNATRACGEELRRKGSRPVVPLRFRLARFP
jgi:hypothetical protein